MRASISSGCANDASAADMDGTDIPGRTVRRWGGGNGRMITCETLVLPPFQPAGDSPEQPLLCDGVSVAAIAEGVGAPAYVYSARAIRDAYRAVDSAFDGFPHAIHYALKANSTLAIVRLLRTLGSRAD